jgi:hypothetical protein
MAQEIRIEVDIDKMELGDLIVLENAAQMEPGAIGKFLSLVERIAVVEGIDDVRRLPIRALKTLVEAVVDAVTEAAEGEEGNSDSG